MGKNSRSTLHIMRRHGRKTEGLISKNSKFSLDAEGTTGALPFFIHSVEKLSEYIDVDSAIVKLLEDSGGIHRFRVPSFYAGLMDGRNPHCPLRLQAVPCPEEGEESGCDDPLGETSHSITPALIQKHPDRAVLLVSSQCAMYCRFCNRKRLVGTNWDPAAYREESLVHIERDTRIREIIVSGGDPFMLGPSELGSVLSRLRSIHHVSTIRISTRMPLVFPFGITPQHLEQLRQHAPLWIVIHINHPKEVSAEFLEIIRKIRESGQILVSQTVLLRNVNDCPHVLSKLFGMLVSAGIKPYYLFQLDEARGTQHFKVRLERGIEIMRMLRRDCSGLALPQYAIDIPGGLGKVPLDYVYVKAPDLRETIVENAEGESGIYRNNGRASSCMQCGICEKRSQQSSTK